MRPTPIHTAETTAAAVVGYGNDAYVGGRSGVKQEGAVTATACPAPATAGQRGGDAAGRWLARGRRRGGGRDRELRVSFNADAALGGLYVKHGPGASPGDRERGSPSQQFGGCTIRSPAPGAHSLLMVGAEEATHPLSGIALPGTPAAVADRHSVAAGEVLTVARDQGVLANDAPFAATRGPLTSTVESPTEHGTLALAARPTPAADFVGLDRFVYRGDDGAHHGLGTVEIDVGAGEHEVTSPAT